LTAIHELVAAARAAENPAVVAKLGSGWLLFGERQFLRGYLLLVPDPVVPDLNALGGAARSLFLDDMARTGDALLAATAAVRINYAIFGNLEPALHAHIVPRYQDEAEDMRRAHPWSYDWNAAPRRADMDLAPLRAQLRRLLGAG
jgi:diadenosine tetraphosphate (Ap4A) HIT family hydrolase